MMTPENTPGLTPLNYSKEYPCYNDQLVALKRSLAASRAVASKESEICSSEASRLDDYIRVLSSAEADEWIELEMNFPAYNDARHITDSLPAVLVANAQPHFNQIKLSTHVPRSHIKNTAWSQGPNGQIQIEVGMLSLAATNGIRTVTLPFFATDIQVIPNQEFGATVIEKIIASMFS